MRCQQFLRYPGTINSWETYVICDISQHTLALWDILAYSSLWNVCDLWDILAHSLLVIHLWFVRYQGTLTPCETSVICSTRMGPSIMVLTAKHPDPGCSLSRSILMWAGTLRPGGGPGPTTPTAVSLRQSAPPRVCTHIAPSAQHSRPSYSRTIVLHSVK